jgi:hypothetical protein
MSRRIWASLVVVAIVLSLAVGVTLDRGLSRFEHFDRKEQPTTITYADKSPHYVGVVAERSWLLGRVVEYSLYAGRDPGFGYGHFRAIDVAGTERPVLTEAVWEPGGVRARFTSGREVYIPARYFLHGR